MAATLINIVKILFLLAVTVIVFTSARRHTPLRDGDFGSRSVRAAECQFGKQIKEMGSTWFADLGPPFGIMYCIKCECIRVQKKKKIVARVQCRNIKNECPTPSCDEPVLHAGRCCKTCPGDTGSPDVLQDLAPAVVPEEEERSMKHFASLLTGRTSYSLHEDSSSPPMAHNSFNLVATGRFTFHKRNLYYSFYTTEESSPRAIQFVDVEGNILEEQVITTSDGAYRNATKKMCGVWRRVPREYRRLLREEKMYVWLLWGGNDRLEQSLRGLIARYRTLSTEMFSSILQPSVEADYVTMKGAGGTAIISTSTAAPSVHILIVFNGVFAPDEIADVPLTVRLEAIDRDRVILDELVRVAKPSPELNVVEVQSPVSNADLNSLTRGNVMLSVLSKRSPQELQLEGRVVTRATCEVFQSPLFSVDTPVSGLTWMYLNREGSLVYNVQIDDLNENIVPFITLVSGRGREKLELTLNFHSGWANGTIDSLNTRELEQLYYGDLAVNVASDDERSLVKGRLQMRPIADARDSFSPVLLKRQDLSTTASLVGMAWLAIDSECSLHYDVMISGLEPTSQSFSLYLESVQFLAPGAPVSRRLLEEFQGNQLEGFVMGLSQSELLRIESGVSHLDIMDNSNNTVLLRAKLMKVRIPETCLPQFPDNDVPKDPQNQVLLDIPSMTTGLACYHGGKFYEEGKQWRSTEDPCTMCHCQQARVKCDIVPCPPLSCSSENITKPAAGQCCPSCNSSSLLLENNASITRGCYMAGQFYAAGSSWYPYLPPNGFMTCTTCTCNANNLEVECQRQQCPPLTCNDNEAFYQDKKACCRECPLVTQASVLGDQPEATENILAEGGCKLPETGPYRNGEEWHPKVASHGEVRCVKCKCKDGQVNCERKRCTRSVCSRTGYGTGKKKGDLSDECCPCRRLRRHHRTLSYS